MSKPGAEYYNLEKVAEVLSVPTAEVNRLREQNKLRGFRDGSNWKFLKEEVHTYLAESIKARSVSGQQAGDSGFDLAGDDASASSFDLLMEDAALPGDDQLVSVSQPKSDVDLAALDNDSDLALAEETQISSMVVPKKDKSPKNELSSSVVPNELESSALILESEKDLGEESILGASGSSPQLGLAGDSGFDVLVAGEEEDSFLQVDDEKSEAVSPAVEFDLEPSPQVQGDDDSESSSQVIEIDVGELGAEQNADPFGQDGFGDFSGFDSGVQPLPAVAAAPASDPLGAGISSFPDVFSSPASGLSSKKMGVAEEEYSTGMLIALVSALVVMLLPGMMLIDTMIHMWSWNDPFVLNSALMGMIANMFGL